MRFIRSLRQCFAPEVQEVLRQSTVGITIGNFDGMHLGHQALFSRLDRELQRRASEEGKPPVKVLVTFFPHPKMLLSGVAPAGWDKEPRFWLVHSLSRRVELAASFGFDFVFRLKFTRHFSQLPPSGFVQQYLLDALRTRVVVVGDDWRFGDQRSGDVHTLGALLAPAGARAIAEPPVMLDGVRVSTSLVKQALLGADFARLQNLLGRPFLYSGRVRHGEKRGRSLGFPTANLVPKRQLLPPDGVYATVGHFDGQSVPAVTDIGFRPTFGASGTRIIETHLIGSLSYDLYGKKISIEFIERLRDEKKFPDVESLKLQMAQDISAAARLLKDRQKA